MCRSLQLNGRPALISTALVALLIGAAHRAAGADPPRYTARFITPGFSALNAAAMNGAGDVVGTVTGGPGTGAWISHAGAPAVFLPLPAGAEYGFANDINDAGVIVGAVGFAYPGYGKAAAWIPDGAGGYTIQQFGTLPGDIYSEATAVNNVGDIIGYSRDGMFHHPALFSAPGGIQNLSSTGIAEPHDINDQRVLVDLAYPTHRLDLDTMVVETLPAPGPGYSSSRVNRINESGQVSGYLINTTCGEHFPQKAARFTDGVGWQVLSGCSLNITVADMNDFGDVIVGSSVRFEGIGASFSYIYDLIDSEIGTWTAWGGYQRAINNARQMAVPATNSVTGEFGIILLTPVQDCPFDLNCDSVVNTLDLGILLSSWSIPATAPGCGGAAPCPSDMNDDGFVNSLDLGMLLSHWTL